MKKMISVLDTSICSSNLGDRIIMDAVNRVIKNLFSNSLLIYFPTHEFISKNSYQHLKESDLTFVGGTNLLSSNMNSYRQWKVGPRDAFSFGNNAILMGVGWWQYQGKPNYYTSWLYKKLLSNNYIHSVRDSYTENQLKNIGITNVINTSCPTMWDLSEEHCDHVPLGKADRVVLTFTNYNQNTENDKALLKLLLKEYQEIYFWTQNSNDYSYMKSIAGDSVTYLRPSLEGLDSILSDHNYNVDYVGTRLHAGIRALQKRRRTLILAIDNRATEISKDTGIPVLPRDDFDAIHAWILSKSKTKIRLPVENIEIWKNQFKAC
jgi:polysaccharide pyruvyl transferase WcaK-like protein